MKNIIILLLLLPLLLISQENTYIGDVNCDNQITSQDASLILQFVTSQIDSLPCQENMNGLTPSQLQDIINMIDIELNQNDEQSISMIGPMYRQDEFSEFNHYYKYLYPSDITNNIYYMDAVRFCAQLNYNNYTDWFLPSFIQIQNYIQNNTDDFVIPNFNENTSYYFWLFLDEIQVSGDGGFLYSASLQISGSSFPYPSMPLVLYAHSLFSNTPHCFCVR